jgi:hypothetical protein
MALTTLQRDICRLLADRRRTTGESYLAGGIALAEALATARVSRDIDVFHDSTEAVGRSWDADRAALTGAGFEVTVTRERPGFVSATIFRNDDRVIMEWAADSAFRFFPLVEHAMFGLALHPLDLATNKVLALVGRAEVRDWVDVLECHDRLQPLGYLAWAACGKDPGFTPFGILEHAARSARYSDDEVAALEFDGPRPSAAALSIRWHRALDDARRIVEALPAAHVGEAVFTPEASLFAADPEVVPAEIARDGVRFHRGRIGGAWPRLRDP